MGIRGLTKLLGDNAPSSIKPQEAQSFFGRKIAIDASMCIYQLLVAVRMGSDNLTNDEGNVTSHITGLFYRSIRLLELGVKPIFVFDGKPPSMKAGELAKRFEAKKHAEESAQKAKDEGDLEAAAKFSRRINRITPEMMEQCKKLVTLLGIPIVNSPCEAEAQCAELVKNDLAYATASEDMDSLTFGTNRLIRQLWAGTASTAGKKGIKPTEYILENALSELDLDMDQFTDLCILCGCDYADGIKGVGVVNALKLVREHGDLNKIVAVLKANKKYTVPEEYPVEKLRSMFFTPEVTPAKDITLKWTKPKEAELRKFLIEENQFDTKKFENGIARLVASRKVSSQVRVDSFFTKKATTRPKATDKKAPKSPASKPKPTVAKKRASTSASSTPNKRSKTSK